MAVVRDLENAHAAMSTKPTIRVCGSHELQDFDLVEECGASARIEPGMWQRHTLILHEGCGTDRLRIDIASCPCVIDVGEISVWRNRDHSLLRQLSDPLQILSLPRLSELLALAVGNAAQLFAYGEHSYLELDSQAPGAFQQPITIEIWMRVHLDLSSVATLLRERGPLKGAIATGEGQVSQWDTDRQLAVLRAETLTAELRFLQTERLALASEFRRMADSKRLREAEIDTLHKRLAEERELRLSLEQEANEEIANLALEKGEMEILRETVARLTSELQKESTRRVAIEKSWIWRVTKPVRGILTLLGVRREPAP